MSELLEAALERAKFGALVLPLRWTDENGICSCARGSGCRSPGKHPLTDHGHQDASSDMTTIKNWWSRWPRANIGERTDDVPCIDVDLPDVAAALGDDVALPATTLVVRTPSGGMHIVLKSDSPIATCDIYLADGRRLGELRGPDAYRVIPPSVIGNRPYTYVSPPELPVLRVDDPLEWLRNLLPAFGYALRNEEDPGRAYEQLAGTIYEGEGRHNALVSYAGKVWVEGFAPRVLAELLGVVNEQQCSPPLANDEVAEIARHFVERREPRPNSGWPSVPEQGDRPQITITHRHMRDLSEDAWAALLAQNSPPVLFRHGSGIAEIRHGEDGLPVILHLSLPALRGRLDRCADWLKTTDGGVQPARPPQDVVEDMMALPNPLPLLRGITCTPMFAADGALVTDAGYQDPTKLYYEARGEAMQSVPTAPDGTDLTRAKQIIGLEWLADFPFLDDPSRANSIAVGVTTVAREMIDGPTPLFVIDAPTPGTGKGLLAQSIGLVVLGSLPAVMPEPRGDDELRKRLTAALAEGNALILLDNIKRRLDSAVLAAALTAPSWSDRWLGRSQMLTVPVRCVWMATGNNLQLDGEIARRTVWIRLDARMDRPWERSEFRHQHLLSWLERHRHELVWAFLVLVRNWVVQGRPGWQGKPLGSYEAWSTVVGGVLEAAGIAGFLDNREELYRRVDAETEEWRALVSAWWEAFGPGEVKAGDLYDLCCRGDLLPELFGRMKDDATDQARRTKLGLALARRRDRRFGDVTIRCRQDRHEKGSVYFLEMADVPQRPADRGQGPADNVSRSDSVAGPAVPCGTLFAPEQENGSSGVSSVGTAENVPQRPAGPADRFGSVPDPAGPLPEQVPNVPHNVPQAHRCRICKLPLSMLTKSNVCGRCRVWRKEEVAALEAAHRTESPKSLRPP